MADHTPGPWKVRYSDYRRHWMVVAAYERLIVELLKSDDAEANARLIASAPTLLTVAEIVCNLADETDNEHEFFDRMARVLPQIRAVVRKARGEEQS